MAPLDTSPTPTSAQSRNLHPNDDRPPTFINILHPQSTNLAMPSPQQPHNAASRYEAFRQQLANHQARHERVEAQAPLLPGPRPFQFIRPPSTSPFYTRPPPGAPTGSPPTAATEDVGTKEPPFNPQKPVAIINGYLDTSTTYPEAWPLPYLAITKYPGMRPRTQLDAKTGITAHVAEYVAAHLAFTAPIDDSSDGVDPTQPQTSQPHSSQSQTSQTQPAQELPEGRPTKEGEQPKPSAKRHLRPERHRGELYTDTGLQGTRSGEFGSEYLNDESDSGSGSLRSRTPGIGWIEGPDTSSSVIAPPNSLAPLPPHPLLHRVLRTLTPSMHDELPVGAGELVYLLKVFDDGWCMVEDVLKRKGRFPRQCISASPVPERSEAEARGRGVEENDGSDGGGGHDIQSTTAAVASLSTEAEPKDQIIDFLAQLVRSRKAARAQVVAAMAAANEAIEAQAAAKAEAETGQDEEENERTRRERLNGLHGMLSTEANKARFTQIVNHLADQEQQEIARRDSEDERLRREVETEWAIREAEEEQLPTETATAGSSVLQKKKGKNKRNTKGKKKW